MLALAGCSGGGFERPDRHGVGAPAQPAPPPVNMAGRWLLSSPGRGQCNMTFGSGRAGARRRHDRAGGRLPGKFFTSRKWTYDQGGLTMRDHNGQPLAQLSDAGGRFDGKATTGEPVALAR